MPAVPASRASAITFQAPAASSARICSTHTYGRHDRARVVLGADLGQDDELAGQPLDQLELALVLERDRAVGDLEVLEPEFVHPRDQLIEAALADRELGQRAAEHHRDPVLR